jgi:hypothetical protein
MEAGACDGGAAAREAAVPMARATTDATRVRLTPTNSLAHSPVRLTFSHHLLTGVPGGGCS